MRIPFHKPSITQREIDAVAECMRSGWLTMGRATFEFERKFAGYIGAGNAVALNSGTSALHLALRAAGLARGDEVIVPAMTFTATAEVVRYFDAFPVIADVGRETHNIRVDEIEKKITPKTRAVIPVHYSGQPADMDEIMDLARKKGIAVIEDAAHSLPASYRGRNIGVIGDMTCFSFYATKTLSTGEGGMITTENNGWAEEIRTLRLHGISKDAWNRYEHGGSWRYDVVDAGYKYNPTDISSSMGLVQLERLDEMQKKREAIAAFYGECFRDNDSLITYEPGPDRKSSWQLYPLKLKLESLSVGRDEFIARLGEKDVGVSVHFIPLYRFSYYKSLGYDATAFSDSEWIFERTLSLPIYPDMTAAEMEYVARAVADTAGECRR
ncbi:MAG: DegT/DnrJ/EryC1/StrS family aminotransferase [Spirochaetes bacterium]|jgi:perosamine synthetase|nr:DegT/DnrJ/EryC1/StrS family aminotransferase [Spirochaetota bacterium]